MAVENKVGSSLTTDLSEKAMLARLKLGVWSARITDNEVTFEIAKLHGADPYRAGHYIKKLSDKSRLRNICYIASRIKKYHLQHTLPWLDGGARVLPAAIYLDYSEHMRAAKREFESFVKKFVDNWDSLKEDAKIMLGTMYQESNYPSDIESKFFMNVGIEPIPSTDDFRLKIGAEEMYRIKEQFETHVRSATSAMSKDLWNRLFDSISRLTRSITDSSDVSREVVVEEVRKLCEILPSLNVSSDPKLEKSRQDIEEKLLGKVGGSMNATQQEKAIDDAIGILENMKGYIGE